MQIPKVPSVPLFNIPHFDKIVHFTLYYILASSWLVDVYKIHLQIQKHQIVLIILFSTLYGGVMEIVQKVIVQNRSGDFFDALANTTGIIVASIAFNYIILYRKTLIRIFTSKKEK